MDELALAFVIGAVFGGLVMVAWVFDDPKASDREPNESGVWPL